MSKIKELPGMVIDRIRVILEPLTQCDEVAIENDKELQKEVQKVIAKQDNKKIEKLEENTSKVYIPLEDEKSNIVKRAEVSEQVARKKAEEIANKKLKQQIKADRQRTRE